MGTAQRATQDAVPTAMVHKHHAANVWLKNKKTLNTRKIHFDYRTPAWVAGPRIADLVEVERQAGIYFVHDQLGIPTDHVFVLSSISIQRASDGPVPTVSAGGSITVSEAPHPDADSRRRAAETRLAFHLTSASGTAEGEARVRVVPTRVYERMRSRPPASQPRATAPPAGARHKSPIIFKGNVQVDPTDPVLSDHAADHISAMTVIVSVERGLTSLGAAPVREFRIDFHAYLEHGAPAVYEITLVTDGGFTGSVRQNDVVCATFVGEANS